MKTKLFFLLSIFLFISKANGQNNFSFKSGEKCEYNVYYNWGFIWVHAAKADLTVKNTRYEGNLTYELKMAMNTVTSFAKLSFKDTMITQVDRITLKPYFIREASYEPDYYTKDKVTYFSNDTVRWGVYVEQERKRGISYDTITAKKPYYDLLTTLYTLRNIDTNKLVLDAKIPMPMLFTDEVFDLYLRYTGKDQIKLKNGKTYNCFKVKPLLAEGKMFEKGEGMTIWISDDKNRIPLMIESKLKVGSVKAMLNSVQNNKFPMDSEVK